MTETRHIQRYGWRPSLPDHRDLIADVAQLKILPQVDPRPGMPPVYDQGQLGSCTANATAAAKQYNDRLDGHDHGVPSRLFIYYGERAYEGSLSQGDTGAFGRDGFKVMHNLGAPPETDWKYDIGRFQDKPPAKAYADAAKLRIGAYKAVPRSVDQFKAVLSNRQTVAFGFTVYESFEGAELAATGVMSYPERGERQLGGHEVLMVGYLKGEPEHALCRNSWNDRWGLRGYFLMPWSVILDPDMSSDFRTIYRALGV